MDLGELGIWSGELRAVPAAEAADAVAELEALGYGTVWVPGRAGGPILELVGALLDATRTLTVATGILNVWMHDAAEVAAARAELDARHPGRFLLGLGISHAAIVDREDPGRYARPVSTMRSYLDALDAQDPPVPREGRVLAALGPRMLELARERSAGAHPYFVPVAHTAFARGVLGPGRLLAPEQAVTLQGDREADRRAARAHVERYLELPNYTSNLLRLGFTEEDLRDGGSDRLLDAIVAGGGTAGIGARVQEHRAAGADHVCLLVVGGEPGALPREEWRTLAGALLDRGVPGR
jgi:probable F420-dependent oxidoreductase